MWGLLREKSRNSVDFAGIEMREGYLQSHSRIFGFFFLAVNILNALLYVMLLSLYGHIWICCFGGGESLCYYIMFISLGLDKGNSFISLYQLDLEVHNSKCVFFVKCLWFWVFFFFWWWGRCWVWWYGLKASSPPSIQKFNDFPLPIIE